MNIEKVTLYKKVGRTFEVSQANEFFSKELKNVVDVDDLYWLYISWGLNLSDHDDDEGCIFKMEEAISVSPKKQLAHIIISEKLSNFKRYEKALCHLLVCDKNDESVKRILKFILNELNMNTIYDLIYE
jgi:hypothetical protein